MKVCLVDRCERKSVTRGRCNAHYQAARRAGEFTGEVCSVEGCDSPGFQRGLCGLHYDRKRKKGDAGGATRLHRLAGATQIRRDGLKQCLPCGEWKPESEFHALNRTNQQFGDGLSIHCRACARIKKLKASWGLTPNIIEDLVREQGGCAICKRTDPGARGWCVDHNHSCCPSQASCGKCLRGILCGTCNSALGLFRENVDTLSNAIGYLYEWRTNLEAV